MSACLNVLCAVPNVCGDNCLKMGPFEMNMTDSILGMHWGIAGSHCLWHQLLRASDAAARVCRAPNLIALPSVCTSMAV